MMKFVALHVAGKARLSMVYLIAMDATNLRRRDLLTAAAFGKRPPLSIHGDRRSMEERRRDAGWRSAPFPGVARENTAVQKARIGTPTTRAARSGEERRSVGSDGKHDGSLRNEVRKFRRVRSTKIMGSLSNIPDGFENRYTMPRLYSRDAFRRRCQRVQCRAK